MKRLIIIIALTLIPLFAIAEDNAEKFVVLVSLAIVDYDQSTESFYQDTGYSEINPMLDNQPSHSDMIAFGVGGILIAYALSEVLPDKWSTIFVDSVIASERFNIEENNRALNKHKRHMDSIPIIMSISF